MEVNPRLAGQDMPRAVAGLAATPSPGVVVRHKIVASPAPELSGEAVSPSEADRCSRSVRTRAQEKTPRDPYGPLWGVGFAFRR